MTLDFSFQVESSHNMDSCCPRTGLLLIPVLSWGTNKRLGMKQRSRETYRILAKLMQST